MQSVSCNALNFGSPNNSNKFNGGDEWEESLNLYSTFFRGYDQQIGRFRGVDVLSEQTSEMSPYQFSFNNPISFNDPLGNSPSPQVSFYDLVRAINASSGTTTSTMQGLLDNNMIDFSSDDDGGGGGEMHIGGFSDDRSGFSKSADDLIYMFNTGYQFHKTKNGKLELGHWEQVWSKIENENEKEEKDEDGNTIKHIEGITKVIKWVSDNSENNWPTPPWWLGPALIAAGKDFRFIKPVGVFGSRVGSSVASYVLGKLLPSKFTQILGKKIGQQLVKKLGTNTLGRWIGRMVPSAGAWFTIWWFIDGDVQLMDKTINDAPDDWKESLIRGYGLAF